MNYNNTYKLDAAYMRQTLNEWLESQTPEQLREEIDKRQHLTEHCLHDSCPDCSGTGRKVNGQSCVHMISCPCSRCNPFTF